MILPLYKKIRVGENWYSGKFFLALIQCLINIEKDISIEEVATKYGISKNTISTWVKNGKYFKELEAIPDVREVENALD